MKPIRLEFSGLNSYRGRQVIDFEKLGADGLFGIFGPTGSGKSSILDAITLALFGIVERANNRTRGIINQIEKVLEVSFEFELGGCRYLVERRYDKSPNDPDSANAKSARLRRIGPEEETVLAARSQDVTPLIEKILGINRDEFARAVVLPQGKFDQFLRMTGGDRAAMLERLFNLERFGEDLVEKVKAVTVRCVESLKGIEGEEQGLGNCSEEAMALALRDLQTKVTEADRIKLEYEKVDKAHREALALRELYQKKQEAEAKRIELDQDRDAVAEMEARSAAAERAEPLRSLIEQEKELTGRIEALHGELQGQANQHAEAAERHKRYQEALAQAEKEQTELVPQLLERRSRLRQALEKAQRMEDLTRKAEEKQVELDGVKTGISAMDKEIAACQGELDGIKIALASSAERRKGLVVNPAEREAIEAALEVLLQLEELERNLIKLGKEHARRKDHTDKRWVETVGIVHELQPDQDFAPGDDVGQWVRTQVQTADDDLTRLRDEHQHASLFDSAAAIARELRENEPCPVCGSKEHPRPAADRTDELARLASEIETAEERLARFKDWEGRLLKTWYDWSNNEPHTRRAQEEMEKAQADLVSAQEQFEKVRGSYSREGLLPRKKELAESEKQLHKLDQERDAHLKKQDELQGKLREQERAAQEARHLETAANQDLIGLRNQVEDIRREINAITGGAEPALLLQETESKLDAVRQALENARKDETRARGDLERLTNAITSARATLKTNEGVLAGLRDRLAAELGAAGFASLEQAAAAVLTAAERQGLRHSIDEYRNAMALLNNTLAQIDKEINGRPFDEAAFAQLAAERQDLSDAYEGIKEGVALAKGRVEDLRGKQARWQELQRQKAAAEKRKALAEDLLGLLRGRKFVSFLAQEHLRDMALEASHQLGRLTNQRYALELAKDKDCEFAIRDDYNGGNRRAVASLSGGEIFLASLALALALSSKIQLRGRYPLGFFFLDEGFGSLDGEKLDKVMSALEKLHDRNRMVGVISHVKEMRERLPRYLEVVGAGEDGGGSEIRTVG